MSVFDDGEPIIGAAALELVPVVEDEVADPHAARRMDATDAVAIDFLRWLTPANLEVLGEAYSASGLAVFSDETTIDLARNNLNLLGISLTPLSF